MSVLLTAETRAVVQGGTGRIGRIQTQWMLDAGTPLVAAVTPGRGGERLHNLPVFDTMREAVDKTGANASILFVPAPHVRNAALEALEAGIGFLIVIAEHVPILAALELREVSRGLGATMIGPNTPGVITPGVGKLGIMPASLFSTGSVGMISRSGTLSYEVAGILQETGFGISTMVGIGGDPVLGTDMVDLLPIFAKDPQTTTLLVVGEIGGTQEERLARALKGVDLPVCAYIAGRTAPSGRRMGHAGALMQNQEGSVDSKASVLRDAGVLIARTLQDIPHMSSEAARS